MTLATLTNAIEGRVAFSKLSSVRAAHRQQMAVEDLPLSYCFECESTIIPAIVHSFLRRRASALCSAHLTEAHPILLVLVLCIASDSSSLLSQTNFRQGIPPSTSHKK